jgi:serine phosphatase RsbU (regulator of sigma subunit)
MPDARYEKWEIALSPGESVLFYSDGIIEARNENMELLGNGRLADLIANSKGPPWGKNILEAVRLWQANTPAGDDMTLLEIWREKEDA